ncbi:MAG: asparagine synthase-related protein [Pseudomonadota bacterium]
MLPDFAIVWRRGDGLTSISHSQRTGQTRTTFSASFATEGLQIAGNWRCDNASELRSELGLLSDAPPARILASAWRKWGTGLANRLHGPFAIALFDAQAGQLFAARDALGIEPLFLAVANDTLAMASDPRAARAACGLTSDPDPAAIAGFLRGDLPDEVCTFHKGLERLPRGHFSVFDASFGRTTHKYFDLTAVPSIEPTADPVQPFQQLLDAETLRCGADRDNVGILLSGGLDSSALAASIEVQRTNPKKPSSFSMTFREDEDWPDGPYLEAIRAVCDMGHHGKESSQHDPMANIAHLLEILDGPSLGYGNSMNSELYQMARKLGVQTLFIGHGGDEVVSYGLGSLNELAQKGRWIDVWRESAGATAFWDMPRWRVFELILRRKRSWRLLRRIMSRLRPSRGVGPVSGAAMEDLLAPEFANANPPEQNPPAPHTRLNHTERDLQEHALLQPMQPHSLETLTLVVRDYGFDLAMPFYSRELVEFSVSLPSSWKLRNGYTRYILREAMRGRVPASILERKDKNDFGGSFIRNVLRSPAVRDLTQNPSPSLAPYINLKKLKELWAKVEQSPQSVSVYEGRALWLIAVLAQWLDSDRDACLKSAN